MAIEELEIKNFRNLLNAKIVPSPNTNFIIGKNGSGKTSLLEAIYYLGTGRSFRTPHSKFIINHNSEEFSLFTKLKKADGPGAIGMGITRDRVQIKIKIANDYVSSASKLAELLPVQLINPDVHKLMEEGPRYRRRFIEWGVFHVKPQYHALWQQCTHVLRQRNAGLRLGVTNKELAYWDTALNDIAEKITLLRENYFSLLEPVFQEFLMRIPELPSIDIKLKKGWPDNKSLLEALQDSRDQDRKKGFTQYGPHRADLKFLHEQTPAKEIISRGQQKMIAALLKLAQVKCLYYSFNHSNPVLLVDDLPAELDNDFREELMDEIHNLPIQNFITATSLNKTSEDRMKESYRVFHVEHGQVNVD